MKIVGIICEYNPFHNGHARQIRFLKKRYGDDCAVVCLMSGNFVQRGHPAAYHKMLRAEAALESGADLVLELPVNYALRSAEGFARGGVEILGTFCDELCFGVESATEEELMRLAETLLSEEYVTLLKEELMTGRSFPAARQRAVSRMKRNDLILEKPNNLLGVEYCKAILATSTAMKPLIIRRPGDYHATEPLVDHPSATALRNLLAEGKDISPYVPEPAGAIFAGGEIHSLEAGEISILTRLRTMTEEEFEALPFGSEGLWRKFMHAAREQATLEEIIMNVKSKRYTRSRIDRLVMCAYLGITRDALEENAPWARVLGFSDRGREVLRLARKKTELPNIGQNIDHPHQALERRCGALYGLFAQHGPEKPGTEQSLRVIYRKNGE